MTILVAKLTNILFVDFENFLLYLSLKCFNVWFHTLLDLDIKKKVGNYNFLSF